MQPFETEVPLLGTLPGEAPLCACRHALCLATLLSLAGNLMLTSEECLATLGYIDCTLGAFHDWEFFVCVRHLNPHNSSVGWVLLLSASPRLGNYNSDSKSNLPEVIQPVGAGAGFELRWCRSSSVALD